MPARPTVLFAYLGDPSGSSRALRQLRALVELGADVRVLAVGELGDALPAGVEVEMQPRPPGRGPLWFWRAHRAVHTRALHQPADLYLASDLYVLPALAEAADAHGGALVFDSRELYAALDASAGRPLVARTWQAVERRYIRRADAVLTVGDAIAEELARVYGIARPTVIPNVPDTPRPPPSDRLRRALGIPDDGRTLVLYQGLFRAGRGLPTLLAAARETDSVRLALIGEGPLEAEVREGAASLGDRARVHPFVHPSALPSFTVGADVTACLIEPLTESLRLSLPNKLFESLHADVPVIASPLPEIRHVVETYAVGTLADPTDVGAVVASLRTASDPARRARWRSGIPTALAAYADGTARFKALIQSLLQ